MIDAGRALPGINGGFRGSAPDLGALEFVPPCPGDLDGTVGIPDLFASSPSGATARSVARRGRNRANAGPARHVRTI
jgi:hypothetical protein